MPHMGSALGGEQKDLGFLITQHNDQTAPNVLWVCGFCVYVCASYKQKVALRLTTHVLSLEEILLRCIRVWWSYLSCTLLSTTWPVALHLVITASDRLCVRGYK